MILVLGGSVSGLWRHIFFLLGRSFFVFFFFSICGLGLGRYLDRKGGESMIFLRIQRIVTHSCRVSCKLLYTLLGCLTYIP